MTKAVDPFEEFLRKKKVEQLQQKLRHEEAPAQPEEDALVIAEEDPEVAERLKEEMKDFFDAGGSAGAELFSKVGEKISDEKVEEIRDALEDVFEASPAGPKQEKPNEAFVDFFKNVQGSFDPRDAVPPVPEEEPVEEPPAPPPQLVLVPDGAPAGARAAGGREGHNLDLTELLAKPVDATQLPQRVDLLCRLVARLVERAQIPESEIIEVLIKSGVEF